MYGTRDAAKNWEKHYSGWLQNLGFTKCKSSPNLYLKGLRHSADPLNVEGCRKTGRQADSQAGRQARRQIQTQMVCPTILKWIVPKRCFETVKRGTLFRNGSSWDAALKRFVPQCCCGLSCNAVLKRFVPKRCSETFHSRPLF